MTRSPHIRIAAAAAAAVLTLALGACGSDEEQGTAPPAGTATPSSSAPNSSSSAAGNPVDRAFVAAMIPHHESAIEMADIARDRADSDFVKDLADAIVTAQSTEIAALKRVDQEIASEVGAAGDLGVADHMRGMSEDPAELRSADPFDRAFIDMMVPHHEGAIAMAEAELEKGLNAELKKLARDIITAQKREIEQMNAHREEEFGGPAPGSGTSAPHGAAGGQNRAHATPTPEAK